MAQSNFKKWFLVILLAIGGGTIFKSMYLREVFYLPWNEFMGVDNTQSGMLMSWLGLVGILSGTFAGVIVDKINNTRLVISLSFIVIALATFYQATAPSLAIQYVVIAILSLTANGFFLVSMVRAVRLVGSSDDQGKLFGFLESGRGVAGSIISAIAVAIFAMAATEVDGIAQVLYCYGGLYMVLGILMWFCLPKEERTQSAAEGNSQSKGSFKLFLTILTVKEVWFAAFAIFATIACYQGTSYLVPYLTDAYGMSTDQAAIVGMIRAYVLAIFAAPVIGIVVDKIGSSIKVMGVLFVLGAAGTALFLFVPQSPSMVWTLIVVLMVVGAVTFALRGIMYAQIDEMHVPATITGTVSGFLLTLGFSPEAFQHIIFGYWLDAYGLEGYNYMFIYMAVMFVIAIFTSILLYRSVKSGNPFAKIEAKLAGNNKNQ